MSLLIPENELYFFPAFKTSSILFTASLVSSPNISVILLIPSLFNLIVPSFKSLVPFANVTIPLSRVFVPAANVLAPSLICDAPEFTVPIPLLICGLAAPRSCNRRIMFSITWEL